MIFFTVIIRVIIAMLAAIGLYTINTNIKFRLYLRRHPEEMEKMIDYVEKHKD